jgi:linoleate 10R-lipoxygenase
MLDVYLSDKYRHHWPEIVKLAKLGNGLSIQKLRKYAMEGCRLSTQSLGLSRSVVKDISIKEGNTTHNLKQGDKVFIDLVSAFTDLTDSGRRKHRPRCIP